MKCNKVEHGVCLLTVLGGAIGKGKGASRVILRIYLLAMERDETGIR